MLEQVSVAFALPSAAGFTAAFKRFMQQCGHVFEDMAADVGDGAFEGEPAELFVGQETEIWRGTRGKGAAQEGLGFTRPSGGVVSSRWREGKAAACGQPMGPQGVET